MISEDVKAVVECAYAGAASLTAASRNRKDEVVEEHWPATISSWTRSRPGEVEVIVLIETQDLVNVSISATRIYIWEKWLGIPRITQAASIPAVKSSE